MASLPVQLSQRVLPLVSLAVLGLGLAGPALSPTLYIIVVLVLHCGLLFQSALSAAGAVAAWRNLSRQFKRPSAACVSTELEAGDSLAASAIEHVVIVAAFHESLSTLRQTLDVLASHASAASYVVCLALEQREDGAELKAKLVLEQYALAFAQITYTIHPSDTIGEVGGKASNVKYASAELLRRFDVTRRQHQVVHVLDSDACLTADYFEAVAHSFASRSAMRRRVSLWKPTVVYDRNYPEMPLLSRLVDKLSLITSLTNCSPVFAPGLALSVYSLSAELADLEPWDAGPLGIGEDFHVFVLGMLRTNGALEVETVCSPVSLSCAQSKAHGYGLRGYLADIHARYLQLYRHAFGQLSSAVALAEIAGHAMGTSQSALSGRARLRLAYGSIQMHWTPALLGFFLLPHFVRGQAVGIETCAALPVVPSTWPLDCAAATRMLGWCATLRTIASAVSLIGPLATDRYVHAANARWHQPNAASRLGLRPADARGPSTLMSLVEIACLPLGIVVAMIVLVRVQVAQLYTRDLVYAVSGKPTLNFDHGSEKPALTSIAVTPC